MAIDLSALSSFTTSAQGLSNLILVNPQKNVGYQPQSDPTDSGILPVQPPKFLFHYEGENAVNLESDITDHYVEDNTAIADQIGLTPEMITVQGFIGELNNVVPDLLEPLRLAAEKLTVLGAYTPELTTTALIAYNNAQQLYATAQAAKNAAVASWSSLTGTGGQSIITGTETEAELEALSKCHEKPDRTAIGLQSVLRILEKSNTFHCPDPMGGFQKHGDQIRKGNSGWGE